MAGRFASHERRGHPEILWFDLPQNVTAPNDGNVWLLALLPHAFARGEPLEIRAPVDSRLRHHALELMDIWARWFPKLTPVEIQADVLTGHSTGPCRTGAFFTAGVDSFYTVVGQEPENFPATTPGSVAAGDLVEDLIYVWGFDIPLRDVSAFERKRASLARIAADLGKALLVVVSNLRETALGKLNWGQVMHGPALGAVASLLQSRLSTVLLSASSNAIDDSTPWGTHALTDALLSTSQVSIERCGGGVSRFDKTARVAMCEVALRNLHVCWKGGNDRNCGECEKCVRTITALEILGVLDKATCFPVPPLLMERLNAIRIREPLAFPLWEELRKPAADYGCTDLATAIDRCLERSREPESGALFRNAERQLRKLRHAVFGP